MSGHVEWDHRNLLQRRHRNRDANHGWRDVQGSGRFSRNIRVAALHSPTCTVAGRKENPLLAVVRTYARPTLQQGKVCG